MAHQKKGGQSGKNTGSVIDDPLQAPVQKSKPKKQKKQSRGKQKK